MGGGGILYVFLFFSCFGCHQKNGEGIKYNYTGCFVVVVVFQSCIFFLTKIANREIFANFIILETSDTMIAAVKKPALLSIRQFSTVIESEVRKFSAVRRLSSFFKISNYFILYSCSNQRLVG